MQCAYHPDEKAVANCIRCEKFVCEQCLAMWGGKAYCRPCYDEINRRQAEAEVVPVRRELFEVPSGRRSRIVVTALIGGIACIFVLIVLSLLQMNVVPIMAAVMGGLMLFWGGIWLLGIAYGESLFCVLLYIFLPVYSVYYVISRWSDTKKPFLIVILGGILYMSGRFGLTGG